MVARNPPNDPKDLRAGCPAKPSGIAVVEDTTAPKLRINHIYPNDLSITVEVGLEDPGDAYPALARCMATTKAELQRVTVGESCLYHAWLSL